MNKSIADLTARVYHGSCPEVLYIGILDNLRRMVGYDFHHIRKKYDVPSMWGNIHSIWKPRGLVGTRLQKEKSGSLLTGPIGLEMI